MKTFTEMIILIIITLLLCYIAMVQKTQWDIISSNIKNINDILWQWETVSKCN